ncbi:MAG: transglycosylase domain-containing protein [Hyphomicrobiaceae bacterium]
MVCLGEGRVEQGSPKDGDKTTAPAAKAADPAGIAGPSAAAGTAPGKARAKGWLSRLPWHRRLLILLPAYGFAIATALLSVQLVRYTVRFPDPRSLRIHEPGPTLRVLARDGTLIAERGERNDFVSLDRLPRHLVDAVIATEDRRFMSHWGLDPSGLLRAALANLRAGRAAQGGSTITQQLAKNLFLSTDRTLSRKLEELVLSVWLELRLTKREILELYLNRVYFGGGAYGVDAAAQKFFGKSARQVTLAEAAVIAGLLKAPSKYSPFANPGHARARARVVIRAMLAARAIGPVSAAAAIRQSVHFADPQAGRKPTGLEFAVDYALDEMPPLASVGRREIIVETTIDADLQRRAQALVETVLAKEGAAAKAGQAAVVVMDTGGGIRALVGGRSFAESQFNRAVKARRQPGSAFKPFVYLAAVEAGLWPESPVIDAPIEIGGWSPRNDDGRYRGPIVLSLALAHSINTVAVRLQQEIGSEKVAAVARRLGIASKLRPDASMALGTSEVGLLELTGAYAPLAAGGVAVETHVLRRISASDGEVLFERREPRPRMVVAPDAVGAMSTMLNAAVVSGTGRRAAFPRHQAAGKTGTTQDFRDAWFVGYTAHLVGGVWLGNDDGAPMAHVTGGSLPARIWHDIMQPAHERLPPRPLPAIDATGIAGPLEPQVQVRQPTMGIGLKALSSSRLPVHPSVARDTHGAAAPSGTTPNEHRMPSEPIDPALFSAALGDGPDAERSARRAPSATQTGLDPARLREALGASRMSAGAAR